MLEQLYSPLIVRTTPAHAELKVIARGCVTRACVRHYLGFAANQWALFDKEEPRRVKPLLYVFRVLLSGIHMMRTGEVNANLPSCNAALGNQRLTWIDELIERTDAVTREDVCELAAELYAPERISAACIGAEEDRFRDAVAPVSAALVG